MSGRVPVSKIMLKSLEYTGMRIFGVHFIYPLSIPSKPADLPDFKLRIAVYISCSDMATLNISSALSPLKPDSSKSKLSL